MIKKRKEEEKLENPFKPVIVTGNNMVGDIRARFNTIDIKTSNNLSSAYTPNSKAASRKTMPIRDSSNNEANTQQADMRQANHKEIVALLRDQQRHNRIVQGRSSDADKLSSK